MHPAWIAAAHHSLCRVDGVSEVVGSLRTGDGPCNAKPADVLLCAAPKRDLFGDGVELYAAHTTNVDHCSWRVVEWRIFPLPALFQARWVD